MGDPGRITEIGDWETIDRRRHPLVAAVAMGAIVAVFATALVGLGIAIREGDRRVEIEHIVVPAVEGLTEDAARALLEETGLIMVVSESPNELVEAGMVFDQEPITGAKVELGSPVTAEVSTGPVGTIVPDTIGQQTAEAQALLATVGLTGEVVGAFDEEVRPGEVLGSEPGPGRRAPADRVVVLQVSDGPEPRTIPEIEGRSSVEVLSELGRLQLVPAEVTTRTGSGRPDGEVLEITPAAGTEVRRDSSVELVVAGPDEPLVVPAVMDLLEATAREAMSDAGVSINVRRVELPAGDPRGGRVVRQGVPGGTEIPEDLVIEVLIGVAPPPTGSETTGPGSSGSSTTTTAGGG